MLRDTFRSTYELLNAPILFVKVEEIIGRYVAENHVERLLFVDSFFFFILMSTTDHSNPSITWTLLSSKIRYSMINDIRAKLQTRNKYQGEF